MFTTFLSLIALLVPFSFDERAASSLAGDVVDTLHMRFDRGEGELPILVPRDETLEFIVEIDVGMLGDIHAGDVVLSSGVAPYRAGLPDMSAAGDPKPEAREVGWVKSVATGGYMGYTLEHELEARLLPQDWPRILYRDSQRGSENRRREIKLGLQKGQTTAWYRNDGHCKACDNREHFVEPTFMWNDADHCKKCKRAEHRVWRDPQMRSVPVGTIDMLSAVYLARSLVREGRETATIPLIDKQRLWNVTLKRGARKRITIPAGTFDCRQVELTTSLPAGEKADEDGGQFQGLFGIQGTIKIWLEIHSGVPVLIQGELPVPIPLVNKLDVAVQLKIAKGTPPSFKPVK